MCGLFGSIGLERQPVGPVTNTVRAGSDALVHRGPDEGGVESWGSVCFGHRRLAIWDLEGGRQPMWSHDRRGLIVYNGEVYNHVDLRSELSSAGRAATTRSDTEAVLESYLAWGPRCVRRLRGMFAFAAVDTERKTALLAVDRLGIKPLYYTVRGGALWFSSELEPLYRNVGPFSLALEALDDYLHWQYIPAPKTIYRGVSSLPPGHILEIDLESGRMRRSQYWRLRFAEDRALSLEDWERELDRVLRSTVDLHLMSDVPFGCFLSGGIDSTLVGGYMAELLEQPVQTFSIGFHEPGFSELHWAELAARELGSDHHVEMVEPDSLGLLPTLVRHYGQPFADSSAIPTYYVARMASRRVKMVLSGDGGDESFAGYHGYETVIRAMAQPQLGRGRGRLWGLGAAGRHFLHRLAAWAGLADPIDRAYGAHCQTACHFAPAERRALFRNRYKPVVRELDGARRAHMDIGDRPLISRLQHLDLMTYLPFDILTKVDRASMANSLEVRVPLLDHVVVETAARIPAELKLSTTRRRSRIAYDKKYILKRVLGRRFPRGFVDRPKMGFGVPLGRWFATSLREEVRRRLLSSPPLAFYFDVDAIRRLLDSHSTRHDQSARIWNLLFLQEWMQSHDHALADH